MNKRVYYAADPRWSWAQSNAKHASILREAAADAVLEVQSPDVVRRLIAQVWNGVCDGRNTQNVRFNWDGRSPASSTDVWREVLLTVQRPCELQLRFE